MSARKFRRSVLVLLTTLLAGCATMAPPPQPVSSDAERAITLLKERWREFTDLRTLADVVIQRGGQRQQAHAVILAKAPGSVRFEALSPMGQPLLVATIHEGRLTAYDATTNEATVGPATAEVTGRVLGLPFEPADLVAVLAGLAVPPPDLRTAELRAADDAGPSLELVGPVNRRRIWMDLTTGQVRQMELASGITQARIVFQRDSRGEPRGFELRALASFIQGSVRYEGPVFASGLPADLFVFTPPKNAKIQEIR